MGKDKPDKAEKQPRRDEYYKKVLGEPDESLIVEDPAEQKKIFRQEAERLARLIADESSSARVTSDCNKLLDEACTLLKENEPDKCTVLCKFNGVKQRLIRAYNSREAQPEWFPFITIFNLIILAVIVLLIILFRLVPGQQNLMSTGYVCLACALWGGFGGVIDAFISMHTHFANQDFDKQYWPWYYFHPILGLSLGAVVFLVLQAGLLTISGTSLQEAAAANITAASLQDTVTANITAVSTGVAATSKIGVTAFPMAVAFLAGFRQRTAVAFLTRIVTAIFQNNKDTGSE